MFIHSQPIPAQRPFDPLASNAPLVVAASYDIATHMTPGLVRRLGRAGRARPMIGGVESGAWVMALGGLRTSFRFFVAVLVLLRFYIFFFEIHAASSFFLVSF